MNYFYNKILDKFNLEFSWENIIFQIGFNFNAYLRLAMLIYS